MSVTERVDEAIFRIREQDADFITADSVSMWAGCSEEEAQAGIDRWLVRRTTHRAVNLSRPEQPRRNLHYVALCGAEHRDGVSLSVWRGAEVSCPRCIAIEHAEGATPDAARSRIGGGAR
jgi:hypothetical protein